MLDAIQILVHPIRHPEKLSSRRRKRQKAAVPEAMPTPERASRGVERLPNPIADSGGHIGRPWRSIDMLAALERRGSITSQMRDAGERFAAAFRLAQLDPMRAGDMAGSPIKGAWAWPVMSETIVREREAVWRALQLLGGMNSPGGSCIWNVIGWEMSIKQWAATYGHRWQLRPTEVTGILIGALGVLAGQ